MNITLRLALAGTCALVLTSCGQSSDDSDTGSSGASSDSTSASASEPPPSDGATTDPATDPAIELSPDVLLPDEAWGLEGTERTESGGVVVWRMPEPCAVGVPDTALDMLTLEVGGGQPEAQAGLQQVAVFPDADAAVAEVERIEALWQGCAEGEAAGGTATTAYRTEAVEVGAQGLGLATDYYGTSAPGEIDETAMGAYRVVTRRGNAVASVALEGGESTLGGSREDVTALAQAAWDALCAHDSEGC